MAKKKSAGTASARRRPASTSRKSPKKRVKKAAKKRPAKKAARNSLVANINARRKKGKSRPKSKSTISKKSYRDMENNWGKKK
jgi:hypothetical protein